MIINSITNVARVCRSLTVSSSSLKVATLVSRFMEWFPILFCDTIPRQSATYASYPNVRTRAFGTLDGSKDWGHGEAAFFAVHVLSRSPVSPWTKTILYWKVKFSERQRLSKILTMWLRFERADVLNYTVFWIIEQLNARRERLSMWGSSRRGARNSVRGGACRRVCRGGVLRPALKPILDSSRHNDDWVQIKFCEFAGGSGLKDGIVVMIRSRAHHCTLHDVANVENRF